MPNFLVHEVSVNGPATHALVIGVGKYPHLEGGSGKLTPDNDEMKQLSSPPISARAFSHWMIKEFNNPLVPIASVAMLISDKDDQIYNHPDGVEIAVECANIANISQAVLEWKARGDSDSRNMMIFYFCGHGMTAGLDMALVLEDFGAIKGMPLKGAMDFREFHLGMDTCDARKQIYFIDACRSPATAMFDAYRCAGEKVLYGSNRATRGMEPREAPIFYSSLSGKIAYGLDNQISLYTQALLKALSCSAQKIDADQKWKIYTDSLHSGILMILKRFSEKDVRLKQTNCTDYLSSFSFHELTTDPLVPVVVGCNPEEANTEATFSCSNTIITKTMEMPHPHGWDVDLTPGLYQFSAKVATKPPMNGDCSEYIYPTFKRIWVEVSE